MIKCNYTILCLIKLILEDEKMLVNYRKLWVILAEREISKVKFRADVGISAVTLTKLNKNELVALSVLVRICHVLKCDIGDIVEVVPEE